MVPLILYSFLSFLTLKGESFYSTQVDIDWSHRSIIYVYKKEDVILGLDVIPYDSYFEYTRKRVIRYLWRNIFEEVAVEGQKGVGEGLIPNIYIPIKFPKPVAGLIGEGGELRISGNERIEFGGSNTQEVNPIYTETYHRSLLPQLEMEQQLRVNLEGTIGQKIHVFIDHDSKREFDIKNTIRLQYKGDEDEIIKEINAGNTDVSLPGGLIGAPTAHKGLFGVKMLAQVGPLDITAIASKEESETQQKNFVGGAVEDSVIQWDTDFIDDRFFKLRIEDIDSIISIRLYRSVSGEEAVSCPFGIAIDYKDDGTPDSTQTRFIELVKGDDKDYVVNGESFIVDLKQSSNFYNKYLGFVLIYQTETGVIDTIGDDITNPDTVVLRMLKRTRNDKDPQYVSWDYEMKNIYALPATNISSESFEMKIFKDETGSGEDEEFVSGDTTYLEYLKMAKPDGTIRENRIDYPLGIVIFPSEKPFLELPVPDSIYNRKIVTGVGRKYYIWMKYKGIQKRYSLGLNVLEGSERVVMDGVELQRGVHYDINYEFGELTFREGVITDPNARISIDYQYLPFMQIASKNLLGARLSYDSGSLKFGSTFIFHSSSSFDKRPKLGSEPTQITLGEIDGRYSMSPDILTSLVNLIPFVHRDAPSSWDLNFDVGLSAPNPNTRGEVYIDDMEGTRSATSLGIARTNWFYGSLPPGKNLDDFETLKWYNPRDGVPRADIYTSLPEYRQSERQSILRIECQGGWGSLLSLISKDGADFEKSEFLEVWARGDGIIHIDIGTDIREEALYKDKWGNIKRNEGNDPRTEDTNGNDKLDMGLGEDTGLDGVLGEDKVEVPGDDANDDYNYNTDDPDDYSRINGTEGNGRLDTEDLDNNTSLNKNSNYYTFEINLRSDVDCVQKGKNGWKLYRIPLEEADVVGNPRWSFIKYIRLWIEREEQSEIRIVGKDYVSYKSVDTIDIAVMEIVGNRWEKRGDIELSYRDNQENTGSPEYEPPYTPETDQYGRPERESSLSIIFEGGSEGSAYTLYGSPKKFIQYNTLALYLKGVNLTGTEDTRFFIRVGGDTLNYYEYSVTIPENWRDVRIPLDSITHLKRERDTLPRDSVFARAFVGDDSCSVLGNPSLSNVKIAEIGIRQGPASVASGEIWIDDIRLLDVEKKIGLAASASTTVRFSDLLKVDLSYRRQDPYFRKFSQEMTPQGSNSTSYDAKFDIGLGKFLPSSWGISLPVNGGMSVTTELPMYSANSDVVLSEEESKIEKSVSKPRYIGVSFSKSQSENGLMRYTIDKISASASYRQTSFIGPTSIDSTKIMNLSAGYGFDPKLAPLKLFGLELRYFPDNFNITTNYSRSDVRKYDVSRDSIKLKESPNPKVLTNQASVSYSPINALTSSYSIKSSKELNYQRETSRDENLALNFSPNIWGYTTQKVSYTSRYNEVNSVEKFEIVDSDTFEVRDATNTNAIDLDFGINIQKIGDKLRIIKGLTKLITNPNLTYTISHSIGMYSLLGRPERDFIFGLSQDPQVDKFRNAKDSDREASEIYATTGFKWRIINLSFAYREDESWGGTIDNKRWSTSKTLPDIKFGLSSLERFFRLKNLFSTVSLSSNFKVNESKEGYAIDEATSLSRDVSLTPSLNLQWKSGITSRISSTYSTKYTKNLTGANRYLEKDETHFEIGLSSGYTFSAPTGIKLPLLSRIRFSGSLVTNLEIKYSMDSGENITTDTKSKDRYGFSVTPSMNYNFSSDISGGARIEYREDNDRMSRMHTRTTGMSFWAEFRF